MSPTDRVMPGIKGKRVPGRPGRFDPSEPLHMTTRRAAKTTTVNGSPSVNGSGEETDSRRGSLDDLRPITSYSNGSQISAKSRRVSDISLPMITPEHVMNGLQFHQPPEEKMDLETDLKPFWPIEQILSPSRKRKRSTHSPPESFEGPDGTVDTSFNSFEYDNVDPEVEDDGDVVELIDPADLSDRETSQDSSRSDEAVQDHEAMAEVSMDITPTITGPVSPATSESASQEDDLPLAKPLNAALQEVARAAEEDAAMEEAEEADDAYEVDDQARSDEEGRPRRGRFGGRRRAQHQIPGVEAAMRRQAKLKTAYRAIARAQKAVLVEIAQRTVDDLETNPELHTQALEHQGVQKGIDDALEQRQGRLQAQRELNTEQLHATCEAEERALKAQCQQQLEDIQEAELDRLEYEILRIARAAQLDTGDVQYETEDEDDVIPRPKATGYRWERKGALDRLHDSRSRLPLETEEAIKDMGRRYEMRKLLADFDDEDKAEDITGGFTVMDSAPRDAANARREIVTNANTLANAATEVERTASIPIIPNEEALGLQMLGDLASRPSITGQPRDTVQSKRSRDSFASQTPARQMLPHLHIQTDQGANPISLTMSPRTTQAVLERVDASMPPPMTPRQGPTAFVRSPDVMRQEQPAPSPNINEDRLNSLQQSPTRPSESRPQSRSDPFAGYNHSLPNQGQHLPDQRFDSSVALFRMDQYRNEFPSWRQYGQPQPPAPARRPSSHSDRPPFDFARGLPSRDERPSNIDPRLYERREDQDMIKDESPIHNQYNSRAPPWAEHLSQAGANEGRYHDQRSPPSQPRRPSADVPPSPRSRNSSSTFSIHDFRTPANQHESHQRQRHKGTKKPHLHKTSKAERGGLPRRAFKDGKSDGKPGSAGSPRTAASSYAGSPVERAPQPAPWLGPPPPAQHSPAVPPPPPPASYQQPSPYGVPPPPHYLPNQRGYDYFQQHRNSYPPPHGGWNHPPPPSPLFAVPQQHQQHPPPPGVPPEQYSHQFPPPPPPGYPPPPPPQTPQSAPGSAYANHFGGPPLAPATPNPNFHAGGFRPSAPLPAFAQQQQNNHHIAQRRRAQSDASWPKFQSYNPHSGRR